jgi:hypothetical protein
VHRLQIMVVILWLVVVLMVQQVLVVRLLSLVVQVAHLLAVLCL